MRSLLLARRAFPLARAYSAVNAQRLRAMYDAALAATQAVPAAPRVDPRAVFVNNELNLANIKVYGFDYDYTLAVYTRELNDLIYDLAVKRLIQDFKYPVELASIPYDHSFAIRGLHFDVTNSCLLKVDAFSKIQHGTVHRGRQQLSPPATRQLYSNLSLPDIKGQTLPQLIDLFSLPWAGLLATTVQYFDDNNIHFDATSMYHDVAACVSEVHRTGEMYARVTDNLQKYVHKNNGLKEYLSRLHENGRELFMVTNSPFPFMNTGMRYMLGDDWRQFFTHVIVSAKKPTFFQGNAPFREYDEKTDSLSYEKVTELRPGKIYAGGNITELSRRAGYDSKEVLYFGDHIYTDLADPMLRLGWHTAAIVPELAKEIRTQNDDQYRRRILWLETLTNLIEMYKSSAMKGGEETAGILEQWQTEREQLRKSVKDMFNPQFGSIFRTYHNMTYFSRRMSRLSEIYTSRLPNLLKYDVDHSFYPRRNALPHENLQNTQCPGVLDDLVHQEVIREATEDGGVASGGVPKEMRRPPPACLLPTQD